jgi:hypothetical protein
VRKAHDEDFYNALSSPKVVRENKSRLMRWAGKVACMDNTKLLSGNLRTRDYVGFLGIDTKIILKWVLDKLGF